MFGRLFSRLFERKGDLANPHRPKRKFPARSWLSPLRPAAVRDLRPTSQSMSMPSALQPARSKIQASCRSSSKRRGTVTGRTKRSGTPSTPAWRTAIPTSKDCASSPVKHVSGRLIARRSASSISESGKSTAFQPFPGIPGNRETSRPASCYSCAREIAPRVNSTARPPAAVERVPAGDRSLRSKSKERKGQGATSFSAFLFALPAQVSQMLRTVASATRHFRGALPYRNADD